MKRLPMRKIKETLRLKAAGLSHREIAASVGVGRSTIGDYLERAKQAGLSWPLPDDLDDDALERRCSRPPVRVMANRGRNPTGLISTGSCGVSR